MIRVRLSRVRTLGSGARRVPSSADSVRPRPADLVLEGILLPACDPGEPVRAMEPVEAWDDAIAYDRCVCVLLDERADDGQARLWRSTQVRLVVVSASPLFVPLRVETQTSVYLVLVL